MIEKAFESHMDASVVKMHLVTDKKEASESIQFHNRRRRHTIEKAVKSWTLQRQMHLVTNEEASKNIQVHNRRRRRTNF